MNILVTGATGLIGRNLLKKIDGNICVISRDKENLKQLKKDFPEIKTVVGDICDERLVKSTIRDLNLDTIYHLAALRAVGIAEREVEECVNTNITGTLNLLKHFKGGKFITLSTDKAVRISSMYGASKFIVEKLVKQYAIKNTNIVYCIIRSGNVFGSKDSVMSVWKDVLINYEEINVTDLEATRFFCTVDQVIECILKNDVEPKLYRALDLKSLSLGNLLEAMQIKYGEAKKINVIGLQLGENKHEQMIENGISSDQAEKYTIKEILKYI